MIPRGEVGLIFAQTGLASGVFTPPPVQCGHHDGAGDDVSGTATLISMPSGPQTPPPPTPEGIEDLVTKP